jgi:hypothetical protein
MAADDVAAAPADVITNAPANGTVEPAGPQASPFDQLDERTLTPGDGPRPTRFEDRLTVHQPERSFS